MAAATHGTLSRAITANDLLIANVRAFYENDPAAWDVVVAYIDHARTLPHRDDEPVSLRLIEYLVRTYAFEHHSVAVDHDGDQHDIATEFARHKHGSRKRGFDAFRRNGAATIAFHGRALRTTYAQLAFFMWCLQSGTLDFAQDNRARIERSKAEARKVTRVRRKRGAVPATALPFVGATLASE